MFNASQRARNNRKPQMGGRVYCLEAEEEGDEDPHAVVSGTFVVTTIPVKVLFDAGATHSFISPTIAAQMTCVLEELDVCLCVTTPIGSTYQSELVAQNYMIMIQDRLFLAVLILLGIHGYDVILGMDWLTRYRASVDCKRKTLTLFTSEGESILCDGGNSSPTISLISAAKACKLVAKGCTAYLCAMEVNDVHKLDIKDTPVVREFPEVF